MDEVLAIARRYPMQTLLLGLGCGYLLARLPHYLYLTYTCPGKALIWTRRHTPPLSLSRRTCSPIFRACWRRSFTQSTNALRRRIPDDR